MVFQSVKTLVVQEAFDPLTIMFWSLLAQIIRTIWAWGRIGHDEIPKISQNFLSCFSVGAAMCRLLHTEAFSNKSTKFIKVCFSHHFWCRIYMYLPFCLAAKICSALEEFAVKYRLSFQPNFGVYTNLWQHGIYFLISRLYWKLGHCLYLFGKRAALWWVLVCV